MLLVKIYHSLLVVVLVARFVATSAFDQCAALLRRRPRELLPESVSPAPRLSPT